MYNSQIMKDAVASYRELKDDFRMRAHKTGGNGERASVVIEFVNNRSRDYKKKAE